MLGFDRLLPLVESVDTYVNVPVELADRLASPLIVTMSQILHHCKRGSRNWIMMMIQYRISRLQNLEVNLCKKMVTLCPTRCYSSENGDVTFATRGVYRM